MGRFGLSSFCGSRGFLSRLQNAPAAWGPASCEDPVEIGSEGRTQELNGAGSRQMAGKTFLVCFLGGETGQ